MKRHDDVEIIQDWFTDARPRERVRTYAEYNQHKAEKKLQKAKEGDNNGKDHANGDV